MLHQHLWQVPAGREDSQGSCRRSTAAVAPQGPLWSWTVNLGARYVHVGETLHLVAGEKNKEWQRQRVVVFVVLALWLYIGELLTPVSLCVLTAHPVMHMHTYKDTHMQVYWPRASFTMAVSSLYI